MTAVYLLEPRLVFSGACVLSACGGIAVDDRTGERGNAEPGRAGGEPGGPMPGGLMPSGGSGGIVPGGTGGLVGAGGQPSTGDDHLTPEEAAIFCDETCAPRLSGGDGCAEVYVCNEQACHDPATAWSRAERDAFAACVQVENLCFFNLEQCMFDQVRPPDVYPRMLVFELKDTEGLAPTSVSVRGKSHQVHGIHRAELVPGTSVLQWSNVAEYFPWGGICAWFDVDGDGVCEQVSDEFAWTMPSSNEDPGNIVYTGVLSPVTSQPLDPCSMF